MTPMPSILITGANKSLGREPTTARPQRPRRSLPRSQRLAAGRTDDAFLRLLRRAQNGIVVNVSRGLDSRALIADPQRPRALERPPTAPPSPR